MKSLVLAGLSAGALFALSAPAMAADAAHGQELFRTQCGVCHMAAEGDGDGGQGPSLKGVIGRKIAGDQNFAYTDALMAQKGEWTPDSLSAFLADPSKAAPGTAMPIKVNSETDRADIAAYLATVK